MADKSRTFLSRKNVIFSLVGRLVGMVCAFAGRGIFVKTLNSEYLGLGGFFGNIFSVISLCELGIGAAISQSLYKPLSDGNDNTVASYMRFFSKVNYVIGAVTFVLSVVAVPFLSATSAGNIPENELYVAYFLFAIHTSLSYVFSPKKCLVICDQRMYVVTAVNGVVSLLSLVLQSLVLVFTGSYIGYLVTRIGILTLRDIWINGYADKKYPFTKRKINPQKGYYRKIYENVKALLWHKVGGTLCRSTDSLLLSVYVGLAGMGKYSNYALVIGTVGAFFDVAVNAASASVGNLGAGDRGKKSEEIMRKMYFLNFFLLTLGLCVMVSTINPFIKLWLGEEMLFSIPEMAVITACFYFSCIRDPVQIFLHTYGIFRETRFIPIVRAVVNFVLSVVFVKNMGMFGVFLGTLLSTVMVPLYFEVKMLYKYGFGNMETKGFLKEMGGYILMSTSVALLCFVLTAKLPQTLIGVVIRALASCVVTLVVLCIAYHDNRYFLFLKDVAKGTFRKTFKLSLTRRVSGKINSQLENFFL